MRNADLEKWAKEGLSEERWKGTPLQITDEEHRRGTLGIVKASLLVALLKRYRMVVHREFVSLMMATGADSRDTAEGVWRGIVEYEEENTTNDDFYVAELFKDELLEMLLKLDAGEHWPGVAGADDTDEESEGKDE